MFFELLAMAQGLLQVQRVQERPRLAQLLRRSRQGDLLHHRLRQEVRPQGLRIRSGRWLPVKRRLCQRVTNNFQVSRFVWIFD